MTVIGKQLDRSSPIGAENAYVPTLKFRVGAWITKMEKSFKGCNIENALFGLINCAERTVILKRYLKRTP